MDKDIKLRVKNISKSFPGVKALDNVSFAVKRGTVHAICGENGAGKSTLMKIINGIYKQDSGDILIDEKVVQINNPIQARSLGISMIFQELNYIPELTIEESLFVGNWPKGKYGNIDWKMIRKKTLELLEKEGLDYLPTIKLKDLSISDIQMLEILKAISYNSDVIIMDEPTSAITQKEVEVLFNKINGLKERGVSIIYISHKMDEIFRIADEITVFRDGIVVDSRNKDDYDMETVIAQMVGRKLDNSYPKENVEIGDKILEVNNLTSTGQFEDINFYLKEGEIVGFAGLMGSGRSEVMRALFGLDPYESGEIIINKKKTIIENTQDSIKNGMVMLSEDRRRFGIIPVRTVKENVSLSNLKRFIYGGRLHKDEEIQTVTEYCNKMNVKTPDIETIVEVLSGGNQQKVILAKWMVTNPDILILDEPTRGIDVGAKYEIYKLMVELAKEKKGLIMISSELPELIGMCDRIYVMAKGRIAGELDRENFSQKNIMLYATASSNEKEVEV
ncbi:fused D-ribose transporter subunits of ABC superfamily: ATP-binding components [[Clostridium] ultunense Esp]|uniref:Ribose ABC transporter (ATP-binding protein) n=1 Tax=[Clostridium] ultunense Esp TaxID=1288971 RepID=M1Z4G0_9FIRM|nr:sugar ABC transporter ATP-binding protein [Schnuerera ultunensis]CCQ92941.1 fused D-ribose transporter subunits of ABC superfamily: ATP-binding components [[Clostridium] ultunense Esp]SHD76428.1 ribose ABC transporter (ATP-binding protein) [[Clostridium] ultunense Esp]